MLCDYVISALIFHNQIQQFRIHLFFRIHLWSSIGNRIIMYLHFSFTFMLIDAFCHLDSFFLWFWDSATDGTTNRIYRIRLYLFCASRIQINVKETHRFCLVLSGRSHYIFATFLEITAIPAPVFGYLNSFANDEIIRYYAVETAS